MTRKATAILLLAFCIVLRGFSTVFAEEIQPVYFDAVPTPEIPETATIRSRVPGDLVPAYYEPSIAARLLGEYYDGVSVNILQHISEEWILVDIHTGGTGGYAYVLAQDLAFGEEAGQVKKSSPTYEADGYFRLSTHAMGQSGDLGEFPAGTQFELLGLAVSHQSGLSRPLAFEKSSLHVKIGDTSGFLTDPSVTLMERAQGGGQDAQTPQAAHGTGIVYSPDRGKVHLREAESTASSSLGMYYAGTEVVFDSDPDAQWVAVRIGNQRGFMKSEFLRKQQDAGSVESARPVMVVSNASATAWLNLRSIPSMEGDVISQHYNGETVTVLGEVGGWSHVLLADGSMGYMMPDYLALEGAQSSATAQENTTKSESKTTGILSATLDYTALPAQAERGVSGLYTQTIADAQSLAALEKILSAAKPEEGSYECVLDNARLTVRQSDGTVLTVYIAVDSCPVLRIDGKYLSFSSIDSSNSVLFALFPEIPRDL